MSDLSPASATTVHELGPNRWVVPDAQPGLFAIVSYLLGRHAAFAWDCTCETARTIRASNSNRFPDPYRCAHVDKVWEMERIDPNSTSSDEWRAERHRAR